MQINEVISLESPGLEIYASLTDNTLRNKHGKNSGLFIAESPKVIKTALKKGYEPVSLLCEKKHIIGDAAEIIASYPSIPVYTGTREILSDLTGYKLTRGVLCAMKRKPEPSYKEICNTAKRIAVIDGVCDTTNIGSIFRSAAALGIDGILLTPDSCDPLNRRSVRVSMGSVFLIPWTFVENPIEKLKELEFITVALALHSEAIPIDSKILKGLPKIAMFLGTEGDGLKKYIIDTCDYIVTIPMHNTVDSLNVSAAATLAFWELR